MVVAELPHTWRGREALRRLSWIRFPPEPRAGLPSHVNLLNAAVTIFSSLPPSRAQKKWACHANSGTDAPSFM